MPSAYNPELSVVSAGMLLKIVSDVYSLTAGSYYTADGVLHTDGGSTWGMYKFPIKKGQWVKYTGPMGITTGSESIPVISQLDSNQGWVSSLRTVNATGAAGVTFQTLYGQATQDGFVAVRGRTGETGTLGAINVYASYDEIVATEDMLDAIEAGVEKSSQYGPGEDMTGLRYFQGAVFDASGNWVTGKGSAYRTYFIPAQKGDVFKYTGAMGSFLLAETIPVLVQTDSNRNFVGIVYPFETDTKILDRAAWGVATQTGFIAVYVRVVSGINFSITKFRRLIDYKTGVNFSAGLIDVTAEAEIIRNIQWQEDGSTVAANGWDYGVIPVKSGDTVLVDGWHDDFTNGVSRPVIVQLDQNKSWVSNLATFKTDGAGPVREVHIADAAQDGYVALIYRRSGNSPFKFMATRPQMLDVVDQYFERELEKNGYAVYTFAPKYSVNNTALDSSGTPLTDTTWRTVYVPANQGDQVTIVTATGKLAEGETADADGNIPYIIQTDKRRANPTVKAKSANTGTLTGNKMLTATASADGYLACRVYALDWSWPSVRLTRPGSGGSTASSDVPAISGQFERLPVNMNALWDYNSSPYSQDNIIVSGDYQYAIVINASRNPVIMQRNKYGGPWKLFDLSTIPGNPLNAPTELDGHNIYSIAVTPSGRITVAGNMHGSAWRGVMSTNAHDITSWGAFDWGNGGTDNTYPSFLTFPDGTLLCYFRRGVRIYLSGISSSDVLNSFRFAAGSKADGTGGIYCNRWVVDKSGVLHACWGYRMDSGSAGANEGLYYAKSADKGQTWTNAAGTTSWALSGGSLNNVRSEKIFNAAQGSGYINQNGGCVDNDGHYHTCITQTDAFGYTQIVHIWYDGSAWKSEVVSKFTFTMDLSLNLVMNDLSRPVIGCTPSGRVYVFYHTTKMGCSGQIRAIDVTTEGSPVDSVIALFDIGTQALACNTDLLLKTGDFVALLAKGTANSASENYGVYSNQPVMLATIPMP
ncbi:BNR-4 repeat-containing protein [Klebsiella pneumoniae]